MATQVIASGGAAERNLGLAMRRGFSGASAVAMFHFHH